MKPIAFIFLHPYLLWSTGLLLVPVLIHLFSFKKFKKLAFSDVSLLKSIHQSGVAKKNISALLVLLCRLLFFFFLIVCFAQPVEELNGESLKNKNIVSIYLDNSFSMGVEQNQLDLFSQAQYLVEKIIDQYSNNDRFQLISNSYSVNDGRLWQKEEAKRLVSECLLNPKSRSISEIYKRQVFNLEDQSSFEPVIYWLSDFQNLEDTSFLKSNQYPINCIVLKTEIQDNLYLDSVWFDSPIRKQNGEDHVVVKIVNNSDSEIEALNVELDVNTKKYFQEIKLAPKEKKDLVFRYLVPDSSIVKGKVSIEDYSLGFDNQYFFSYTLPKTLSVLSLSEDLEFINLMNRVLGNDTSIVLHALSPKEVSKSAIQKADLIVLGELKSFSSGLINLLKFAKEQKKGVLVVPSINIDFDSYNSLAKEIGGVVFSRRDTSLIELKVVDEQGDFYQQVFDTEGKQKENVKVQMPLLKTHYQVEFSGHFFRKILQKSNSESYLLKDGNLQYLTSPITVQGSDISSHPLIVPLLYQAVFNAVYVQDVSFVTDNLATVKIPIDALVPFELIDEKDYSFFPYIEMKKELGVANVSLEKVRSSGFYELKDANKNKVVLALNYPRFESKEIGYQLDLLKALTSGNPLCRMIDGGSTFDNEVVSELVTGKTYWKYFLGLALLFLLLEMFLIRFFSKKTIL